MTRGQGEHRGAAAVGIVTLAAREGGSNAMSPNARINRPAVGRGNRGGPATAGTAWRRRVARNAPGERPFPVATAHCRANMYPDGHVTLRARDNGESAAIWRALGNATRRRMVDALRVAPHSTGELATALGISRFAVMKHLHVLARAGLITAAREGRLRWNRLNTVPLQELYRRWVRPEEAVHAERILRLQDHLSLHLEQSMGKRTEFRSLDIVVELEVAAPSARTWQAVTEDISQWWPAQFYTGSAPRRFVVEGFVGGRVYEDWNDGEGSLFGTVTAYQAPRLLQWAADMSAEHGGPARTVTTIKVEPGTAPGSSRITFRDTPFGSLSPKVEAELAQGWRWLMESCLRPYLESGKRPERPATLEGAANA
jgi:DNA-binding transcriptional ArsR family regulator/uncharacterized protein YndB with AHSA1/START domain